MKSLPIATSRVDARRYGGLAAALIAALLCVNCLAHAAAGPGAEQASWVRNARVAGLELHPWMTVGEVAQALDELAAQNVNVVEADSTLSLYLDDESFEIELAFIRRTAAMAHRRGMRLVWYQPVLEVLSTDVAQTGRAIALDHPEWVQRGIDGTPNVFYGGGARVHWVEDGTESAWMTLESPYGDIFVNRMRRIAASGVDGLWLDVPLLNDIAVQWADTNPHSTAKFVADTGRTPPTEVDWESEDWRAWVAWRHRQIASFLERVAEACTAVAPDFVTVVENVTLDNGNATRMGLDGTALKTIGNLINVWEIDAVSDRTGMREASGDDWSAYVAMNKFARGASGDKPSWVMVYGHSPDDAEIAAAATVAAGNNPYETRIPVMATTVDGAFRERMYRWIENNSARLFESRSAAEVAVLFSPESRDFVDQGRASGLFATTRSSESLWWSTAEAESLYNFSYLGEYRGLTKWLMDSHVPYDVIVRPEAAELSAYPLVLAPNLTAISDAEAAVLKDYVLAGGNLVITGESLAGKTAIGTQRTEPALAALGGGEGTHRHPVSGSGRTGTLVYTSELPGYRYLTDSDPEAAAELARYLPPSVAGRLALRAPEGIHVEARQLDGELLLHFVDGSGFDGSFSLQPARIDVDLRLPDAKSIKAVELTAPKANAKAAEPIDWRVDGGRLHFSVDIEGYAMAIVRFDNAAPTTANDAPVAHSDTLATTLGKPLFISPESLTDNDGDLDGDRLEARNLRLLPGAPGELLPAADGFIYRPPSDYLGTARLAYAAYDRHGAFDEAHAEIRVTLPSSVYRPRWVRIKVGAFDSGTFTSFLLPDGDTYDLAASDTGILDYTIGAQIDEARDEIETIAIELVGQFSTDGIRQTVYLYNVVKKRWIESDRRIFRFGDDVPITIQVPGRAAEFLSEDSTIRLRITAESEDDGQAVSFTSWLNAVSWQVSFRPQGRI